MSQESYYTGWPQKNATLSINDFKKKRNRINKLCPLLGIKFFCQHADTKIVNFDSMAVFLKQCHFQNLPLPSQKSQLTNNWRTANFHCLAPPGKVSALGLKNEDSLNKEKHSLRNFAALQSQGSYSKKFLPSSIVILLQKEQILKMTLPQKNGSKIKTPSSKSLIMVSFGREKNVLFINALTNLI